MTSLLGGGGGKPKSFEKRYREGGQQSIPTAYYIPPFSWVFVAPRPSIDVYDTILDSSAQKELQFFGYIGVGAF